MNTAIKLHTSEVRSSVLIHGTALSILYIIFLLSMKMAGLLYITELRIFNYVMLGLVCFYQIKKWIRKDTYVPFLRVFSTVLLTGLLSFFLFSIFTFFYSKADKEMSQLFQAAVPASLTIPHIVVFFEGTAASIIAGFIAMQYFRRFEEGPRFTSKA